MSIADAVYDYLDFLLDKKSFSLRGPANMEPQPDKEDFDMNDPREHDLYESKRLAYRSTIEQYKQKQALQIMAFVIVRLMELSPKEAIIQWEIPGEADKYKRIWKLDKVMEYVRFPPGIQRDNYRYLFSLIFPREISFDENEQALVVYRKVLRNELTRFPRNFFRYHAHNKLYAMLLEYITLNIRIQSPKQIYEMFRDPGAGNRILKDARLFSAYRDYFTSPLEFVHMMMISIGQEDPVLYNIYSYLLTFEEAQRGGKSRKTSILS